MPIDPKIGSGLRGLIPNSKPHGGIKGVLDLLISDLQASAKQTVVLGVEDLAADGDIVERVIWSAPQDVRITDVKIWGLAASSGVDDSNTSVWDVYRDANTQTIVSETFDSTTTFPSANTPTSLGALDATHRDVLAGENILLSITNGTTADLPEMRVQIEYQTYQADLNTVFETS